MPATHPPACLACRLLDSLPDVDLASHLPALLPGLLGMLSDDNSEIRSACTKLLQVCVYANVCICECVWGGAVAALRCAALLPHVLLA